MLFERTQITIYHIVGRKRRLKRFSYGGRRSRYQVEVNCQVLIDYVNKGIIYMIGDLRDLKKFIEISLVFHELFVKKVLYIRVSLVWMYA